MLYTNVQCVAFACKLALVLPAETPISRQTSIPFPFIPLELREAFASRLVFSKLETILRVYKVGMDTEVSQLRRSTSKSSFSLREVWFGWLLSIIKPTIDLHERCTRIVREKCQDARSLAKLEIPGRAKRLKKRSQLLRTPIKRSAVFTRSPRARLQSASDALRPYQSMLSHSLQKPIELGGRRDLSLSLVRGRNVNKSYVHRYTSRVHLFNLAQKYTEFISIFKRKDRRSLKVKR